MLRITWHRRRGKPEHFPRERQAAGRKEPRAVTPRRIARASAHMLVPQGRAVRPMSDSRGIADARFSFVEVCWRAKWPTPPHAVEPTRRDFLFIATGAAAAVGAATLVWPFVQSLAPDAPTVAAGAPVDVDLTPIAEGQIVKVFWRGKLIFVRNRTERRSRTAEAVNVATLRDPQTDSARVKEGHAKWLDRLRQLHPSRLRAARPPGRLRGLVLPLPRLGLRHVRPHPRRPGADQPADPALRLHVRHQDPDRRGSEGRPPDRRATRPSDRGDRHERTSQPPTSRRARFAQVVREPAADRRPRALVLRRLPGPAQPELFLDLRRDPDRSCSSSQIVTGIFLAMHYTPNADAGLQLRRAHHARRELRLAAALPARQRRLDVLRRGLHPHLPRPLLRLVQGARARCSASSA